MAFRWLVKKEFNRLDKEFNNCVNQSLSAKGLPPLFNDTDSSKASPNANSLPTPRRRRPKRQNKLERSNEIFLTNSMNIEFQ